MYLGSINTMPHSFSFEPNDIAGISEQNELRVTVYDIVGNKAEQTVLFNVQKK